MRCFNGRCPPPVGKVRPRGPAGEEEASGWHNSSRLQGHGAVFTLPRSPCCIEALHRSHSLLIILGELLMENCRIPFFCALFPCLFRRMMGKFRENRWRTKRLKTLRSESPECFITPIALQASKQANAILRSV